MKFVVDCPFKYDIVDVAFKHFVRDGKYDARARSVLCDLCSRLDIKMDDFYDYEDGIEIRILQLNLMEMPFLASLLL